MFVLLGAIINVAVAWGLASVVALEARPHLASDSKGRTIEDLEPINGWVIFEDSGFGMTRLIAWPTRDVIAFPEGSFPLWSNWERALDEQAERAKAAKADGRKRDAILLPMTIERCGWPMSALYWEWIGGASPWRHAIRLSSRPTIPPNALQLEAFRALPLHPIWPGFAINTIFYAALLWLPFAALGRLRRRHRIKRGLCSKCAYDLRGSASQTCPECGKAVKP